MSRTRSGHYAAGEKTRQSVLEAAVEVASEEGLEGLTIGRLADELGLSKSGLFAHFGSKEELQLATVDMARAIFIETVIRPAFRAPRGLARLRALTDRWITYSQKKIFRGGCFFAAAATEFDSRPGPVRDRIAEVMREWMGALETAVVKAIDEGDIDPETDPKQIAYELHALVIASNTASQLLDDRSAYRRARTGVARVLDRIETRDRASVTA